MSAIATESHRGDILEGRGQYNKQKIFKESKFIFQLYLFIIIFKGVCSTPEM